MVRDSLTAPFRPPASRDRVDWPEAASRCIMLGRVKVKDVVKRLEREGWIVARKTAGSHRAYINPQRPGAVVIVSDHGSNAEMKLGTYNSIAKTAGRKK